MKPANNLIILFIFVAGLFMGFIATRWVPLRSPQISSTSTILQQVQTLSQLVTVKYVMEKVINLEDVKPWPGGESRVTLLAHAVAKAGINLEGLKASDIDLTGAKVVVTLPGAVVTDVYLDEHLTQVLDKSTGLFRLADKDMEQNARRQAVDDIKRAAIRGGIAKDAQDRAKAQLTGFFHQLGYKKVEIVFK